MPITMQCPYFMWEEGLDLFCEGCKLRFRDKLERWDYVYSYCAALPGWEDCTVAKNLTRGSERRDENNERKQKS